MVFLFYRFRVGLNKRWRRQLPPRPVATKASEAHALFAIPIQGIFPVVVFRLVSFVLA